MTKRLRVLTISTMFPNSRMPVHAQFVKQRIDAVSKLVDITVVSPIPFFPGQQLARKYRNRHFIPASTNENGYPTFFPRFLSIPGMVKPLDGIFLAWAVQSWIRKNGGASRFDLIDCHLAFPEGFAGAMLSRDWRTPFVVTLRGHDINDLYKYPVRRRQVLFALRNCSRYFGVCQALVDGAVELGAPADKGFRSSNGVNPKRFFPSDRASVRSELQMPDDLRYMVSVSHLVKRKGIEILIKALGILQRMGHGNLRYIIVGKGGEEGDYEAVLKQIAEDEKVSDKIIWAGAVSNPELHRYYSAADLSCLASEKEGWPNVVLESMACGTPVVAMATWGVPEIIHSDSHGILVHERTPEAFAEAIDRALNRSWDRGNIVSFAEAQTWDRTAEDLHRHYMKICA
jgi:teichuronic acid biosynthesis glycosyltransferase TuaC